MELIIKLNKANLTVENQVIGSPLKNPDIKTPQVVSFSLGVGFHFRHLRRFDIRGKIRPKEVERSRSKEMF